MTKRLIHKIITVLAVAVLVLPIIFVLGGCNGTPKSEPIPVDGTVFAGRHRDGDATVVVIYDGAAYIGYLRERAGYATFPDRFSRLTLAFDGNIYRVTNMSSLWPSAIMHGAYPQGLVFNEDGTMSWVSVMSSSPILGSSVTLDGIRWPTSSFTRLDNVDVEKLGDSPANLRIENNILYFESLYERVFVEQAGENELFGFGANSPIDLTYWNFTSPGEFEFRLRSLGGYPTFDADGYLKRLTVSSDLSSFYANIVVAKGEQVASPSNLRITSRTTFDGREWLDVRWDRVPYASRYTTDGGFGNVDTWASVGGVSELGAGRHTVAIVAHRDRAVINGVITFFPSSEPATLTLRIYRDGTFSYSS